MFTGLIEETGTIRTLKTGSYGSAVTIAARNILAGTKPGDSFAVNGICVTATTITPAAFTADIMNETLSRTNLAQLRSGSPVNLERAMAADGRFGGHIVTGHIDGTGTIREIKADGQAVWYLIQTSKELLRGIVEKGSIAIDGISLTVAQVWPEQSMNQFAVSVIPHTLRHTTLPQKRAGDDVNLETDIIGKYITSLMPGQGTPSASGLTAAQLQYHGF